MVDAFHILPPRFDAAGGLAHFSYRLGDLDFTETVQFPDGGDAAIATTPAFAKLLGLTAIVLGVSYFKLKAPPHITCTTIPLAAGEHAFALDIYTNGLGEFYARNGLHHFDRITMDFRHDEAGPPAPLTLRNEALLPIGGGKDSLVSAELLEAAGIPFAPFAVNPKGPILKSAERLSRTSIYVTRVLDPLMLRLATEPGYLNGHVPSTAIISMIAALSALLFGFDRIILSNERSASEGNAIHDGREVNHQYSKSLNFETRIAAVLAAATGGALGYFSLLRPYSEARIARIFARETRFDHVFSSCNRNFKLSGNDGPLWCGECPKCHFVFLIFAPAMPKERVIGIFGQNLLANLDNQRSFRELTGLAGQKPWECVGEILEAAACLYALTEDPRWADEPVVAALAPDLLGHYGADALQAAMEDLLTDSPDHHIPPDLAQRIASHAV